MYTSASSSLMPPLSFTTSLSASITSFGILSAEPENKLIIQIREVVRGSRVWKEKERIRIVGSMRSREETEGGNT